MELNEYVAQMERKFEDVVKTACSQRRWVVKSLQGRNAELSIGDIRSCIIINNMGRLAFFVPSRLTFDSLDEIPHHLSTLLLSRNDVLGLGFWCLEELDEKHTYTCMHKAEMRTVDDDDFAKIVINLVSECDTFEDSILNS